MVFVPDPEKAARWWASFFGTEVTLEVNDDSQVYAWFDVAGVEYGWHPAEDERNPRGASPVIYWKTDDLTASRERLLAAGCTPHRGTLRVDDERQICQLVDPFGTVIGLDGP
jgi:predicted enzyme related to lactoylglutathione lyase